MSDWRPGSRRVSGWPQDLRDVGPSGPVESRQMTDEERAKVDALPPPPPKPSGLRGNSWGGRTGLSRRQVEAEGAAAANGTGTVGDSLPPVTPGRAQASKKDAAASSGSAGSYPHESNRLFDVAEGEGDDMPRGVPLVQDEQAFRADLVSGRSQQEIAEVWGIEVRQLREYCGRLHIPRPPMRRDAVEDAPDGELVSGPEAPSDTPGGVAPPPSAVYPAFGADTVSAPVAVNREYRPIAGSCTSMWGEGVLAPASAGEEVVRPLAVRQSEGGQEASNLAPVTYVYRPEATSLTPSPLDSIRERIASDLEQARQDAYTADLRRDRLARALEAVDSALAALAEAGVSA